MVCNTHAHWPALGAAMLGLALAGCGQNAATDATTASAPAAHSGAAPVSTEAAPATGDAPAELSALFPGAQLQKKAFPLAAAEAAHLSEMAKVKFTGAEKEWEVYEASQNGARVGYAMMTHMSASGGDTHVVFAVDKSFKITRANALDAPKMKPLVAQAVGKGQNAKWKLGQDFKPVAGLSASDAQAAVDALHKGIVILEENFNPLHGEHAQGGGSTSAESASTGSASAPGHGDDHAGHNH